MKADTVAALFMLILALGGAAGAYFWFDNNRRVENADYEAAIDDVTDRELRAGQLGFALDGAAGRPDKLTFLRELYADPSHSQTLSLGFGAMCSRAGAAPTKLWPINSIAKPSRNDCKRRSTSASAMALMR
ncbi:MAG: hypothetical protein HY054_15440 [Proteobacteria bacterium]|nr:hypothetical protein [Pseudomonadota bacterium]